MRNHGTGSENFVKRYKASIGFGTLLRENRGNFKKLDLGEQMKYSAKIIYGKVYFISGGGAIHFCSTLWSFIIYVSS